MAVARDESLDALLHLDGEVFVIDAEGGHWVKFDVKQVEVSPERPHGLRYSLTLHDDSNARLVGFDNAHAVKPGVGPSAASAATYDHSHRFRTVRPYDYKDAASLLSDFWNMVDAVLAQRGVKL